MLSLSSCDTQATMAFIYCHPTERHNNGLRPSVCQ